MLCSCSFTSEKDRWAKEPSKIKYTAEREKEVWGGVLKEKKPELFYGTNLYDLAKEISSFSIFNSETKIEELIKKIPEKDINYQEEKFGMTIGHFALKFKNLKAIRHLLDKGLNPNLISKERNVLIIDINNPFISRSPEGLETLKYMIKKGANVNLYSKKSSISTPLIEAANSNFDNVKILVEAGANPHFIDNSLASPFESPLSAALVNRRMEIINYLIFDQKVDFKALKYPMDSKFHPGEYEILYRLREIRFDLNTQEYKKKMKLVTYLKTQGLDYRKTPIPDNIKNNPNFTKEYLSKY